jgi:hypothetical protein
VGEPPAERVCRGTLLSRTQYVVDVERWGYADGRLDMLSLEDLEH